MRYSVLRRVYGWAVALGWMGLAGEILAALTRVDCPRRRYRVLILSKAVFALDVRAVMARSRDLTFLHFPRLLLGDIVRRRVGDFEALNDATYYPRLDGTPAQDRIRADMAVVFDRLRRRLRIDAVLAGNFVYVSQQEFFHAARAAGVPIVVLYKEGMAPVGTHAYVGSTLYRTKQSLADRVLVYNEHIRDMLVTAQIPGLSSEQTAVVGVPRFDDYVSYRRREPPATTHVVVFAFDPETKAAFLVPDPALRPAMIRRLSAFQADFVRYAAARPDVRVTVKTKSADDSMRDVRRLFADHGFATLPPNVTVTSSGSPATLLPQATAVAGYVSTTLLEALMLDVPVICPSIDDVMSEEVMDYFRDAPEAVTRVASYESLSAALDDPTRLAVPDAAARERVLVPLVYRVDGRASERVEAELVNAIRRARSG